MPIGHCSMPQIRVIDNAMLILLRTVKFAAMDHLFVTLDPLFCHLFDFDTAVEDTEFE